MTLVEPCFECGQDRVIAARGCCSTCYRRLTRQGRTTHLPRLRAPMGDALAHHFSRVDTSDPLACWPWPGPVGVNGYGEVSLGRDASDLAHRQVFVRVVGPIPDGLTINHVCHDLDATCTAATCRHRRCVNPAHLVLATSGDNSRSAHTSRATCRPGRHARTPENTGERANGARYCLPCDVEWYAARKVGA